MSKCAEILKPCDKSDYHCDGIDWAGWHVGLVKIEIPKTEGGTRQMARDYFSSLGMEADF